jgi:hypothetical protein
MKTHHVIWMAGVVIVLATVAILIPNSPVYLPKLFGGYEREYEGHGTSYWVKTLNDSDEETRRHAIFALGAIGPDAPEAVPRLAEVLVKGPGEDRAEAALALTKMYPASEQAVAALAQALEDQRLIVRMRAAQALAHLGAKAAPAVPALFKAVKDKNNDTNLDNFPQTIQQVAVLALGRATAGTDEAVPELMAGLQAIRDDKTNPEIKTVQLDQGAARMAASSGKTNKGKKDSLDVIRAKIVYARALGEIGPKAKPAVSLLKAMLAEDQISDFKLEAQEALRKIEGETTAQQ